MSRSYYLNCWRIYIACIIFISGIHFESYCWISLIQNVLLLLCFVVFRVWFAFKSGLLMFHHRKGNFWTEVSFGTKMLLSRSLLTFATNWRPCVVGLWYIIINTWERTLARSGLPRGRLLPGVDADVVSVQLHTLSDIFPSRRRRALRSMKLLMVWWPGKMKSSSLVVDRWWSEIFGHRCTFVGRVLLP